MVQLIGRLFLVTSLIYSPLGYSAVPSTFSQRDVTIMNSFSTSHEVFKAYLALKGTPPEFTSAVKDQLKKKPKPMPYVYLMEKGEIGFALGGHNYRMARDANNNLYLDGSPIDLNSREWSANKSAQQMFFRFPRLIESAEAALPLLAIKAVEIIGGAIVLTALGCTVKNLGSGFSKNIGSGTSIGITAKRLRVSSSGFDEALNSGWAEICPSGVCSVCAAGEIPNFAYKKHFVKLCSRIAKKYSSADELDAKSKEMERIVHPRQVPRSLFMVDVAAVHNDFREKRGNQTPHLAIDGRIAEYTSDQDFMNDCVKQYLPISPTAPREDQSVFDRLPDSDKAPATN